MTPKGGARIGAGRKPASETGRANGRRVNVYLTPANFETWRGLPPRKRSKFVNEAMSEVDRLRAECDALGEELADALIDASRLNAALESVFTYGIIHSAKVRKEVEDALSAHHNGK